MADIKTHLRELSVAVTIGLLKSHTAFSVEDLYDPAHFYACAERVIAGSIASAQNIAKLPCFTNELKEIVYNGFRLWARRSPAFRR